jgi:hypothetical protein
MNALDIIRDGYESWIELLKRTSKEDLLTDPYDVWTEAFHVGAMLERRGVLHAIHTQIQLVRPEDFDDKAKVSIEDAKQLQISMLKQVIRIIEAKGL